MVIKTMDIKTLTSYLDSYLRVPEINDFGPQGLQVESQNSDIKRIALAVDTAPIIIQAAADWQADMLLAHHGILWRSVERISGPLGQRVRQLITSGINLYAAHLALDAHPVVGNNAVLAKIVGLKNIEWWCEAMGTKIGVVGETDTTLDALHAIVNEKLDTEAVILNHGPKHIKKLAVVSGFGADRISEANALGADTFLTGETSHANFWAAADYGMNVIFGGHYATETVGVKALGQHLNDKFGIATKFFNYPTNM